jgi:hypothetical protein
MEGGDWLTSGHGRLTPEQYSRYLFNRKLLATESDKILAASYSRYEAVLDANTLLREVQYISQDTQIPRGYIRM